ncbi:gamma-glutamylcyclotransferase family protein [Terriglobus sp.]|uniref:gamma-glutamylcyclotransferase family protein n=1 Tax=Terriglobus sp. TaxID=1889013 RepID=UPI003B00EF84
MTSFVFAYGSNMCSGRFRAYNMTPLGSGRAAMLDGYVLRFNKQNTDGSGKATIFQSPGNPLWGVLYEVPTADVSMLDGGEQGYGREIAIVLVEDQPVTAWLYIAKRPVTTTRLHPYSWYKRLIVEGAREHTLPPDYIARLEAIEDHLDPNQTRHAQRMSLLCSASDCATETNDDKHRSLKVGRFGYGGLS